MTNPNATSSSPRKNKSRSTRKNEKNGSSKGNGGRDDLMTPDSLRKVLNTKPQPDMDVIPTRDVGLNPLDLLQRRDNVDNLCKYQPTPRSSLSPNQQGQRHQEKSNSPLPGQRWAGASFSNSPAANSLPVPSSLFLAAVPSEPSFPDTARRLDFGEAPNQPMEYPLWTQPSMMPPPSMMLHHHQLPPPSHFPLVYGHHGSVHHTPPIQPVTQDLTNLSQHIKFMLNIRA